MSRCFQKRNHTHVAYISYPVTKLILLRNKEYEYIENIWLGKKLINKNFVSVVNI
jgi:hypothetical protein